MDNNNSMAQFMDQIDLAMRVPRRGHVIKGKIVQVTDSSLIVNIGYKSDGIVPLEEISSGASSDALKGYEENQELDVYIVKTDDGEGNVLLSLKRVSMDADWTELEEIYAKESLIDVKVTEAVKGGVVAYYKEARGFIPASQLSVKFVDEVREFVGKTLSARVIEFNRERKRAVFSHKVVMQKDLVAKKAKVWEKAVVGATVEGEVKRITNFGVFIDLGGIDGMVHISELTWGRIKSPQDLVKIGQTVAVKVIGADPVKEKISLSLKQLNNDPWSDFETKYVVGQVYTGKVVNLTDFGAFVELEPGVEGLVHVSHISKKRIEKPSDELKIGDSREVKLLEVDVNSKKVKLSIKEAQEPTADAAEEAVTE